MRAPLALLLVAMAILASSAVAAQTAETALICGRFYTQASAQPGLGYAVTDDATGSFFTSYERMGGPNVLGYPVSLRFPYLGGDMQIFQRFALVGSGDSIATAPLMDILSASGKDPWLASAYQIPEPAPIAGDPAAIVAESPAIAAAYASTGGDPLSMNGNPVAPLATFGDIRSLRTDRTAIQETISSGSARHAGVGEMARLSGAFPENVFAALNLSQAQCSQPAPSKPAPDSQQTEVLSVVAAANQTGVPTDGNGALRVAVRVTDATGRPAVGIAVIGILRYPPKNDNQAYAVDRIIWGPTTDDRGASVLSVSRDAAVPAGLQLVLEVSAAAAAASGRTVLVLVAE